LRQRDPDLLDRLIEQYQQRLYRYLLSFSRAIPRWPKTLFQETWIRVLERGSQYNGKSKFDSWLFAIRRRNLVIDASRPQKKSPAWRIWGDPGRPAHPTIHPTNAQASVLQMLVSREKRTERAAFALENPRLLS